MNDENCNSNQFDYKRFCDYDMIIINSTNGTGKTRNTAKHTKTYIDEAYYNYCILYQLQHLEH